MWVPRGYVTSPKSDVYHLVFQHSMEMREIHFFYIRWCNWSDKIDEEKILRDLPKGKRLCERCRASAVHRARMGELIFLDTMRSKPLYPIHYQKKAVPKKKKKKAVPKKRKKKAGKKLSSSEKKKTLRDLIKRRKEESEW